VDVNDRWQMPSGRPDGLQWQNHPEVGMGGDKGGGGWNQKVQKRTNLLS